MQNLTNTQKIELFALLTMLWNRAKVFAAGSGHSRGV